MNGYRKVRIKTGCECKDCIGNRKSRKKIWARKLRLKIKTENIGKNECVKFYIIDE